MRGPDSKGAPPGAAKRLYFLSAVEDRSRLPCLVSEDNGATWRLHAVSARRFDARVYSIGGFREVTPDGDIVGTFTMLAPWAET